MVTHNDFQGKKTRPIEGNRMEMILSLGALIGMLGASLGLQRYSYRKVKVQSKPAP